MGLSDGVPKTVLPRQSGYKHFDIIVITKESVYVERTDTYYEREDLAAVIEQEPGSIVVGYHMGEVVHDLTRVFAHDEQWNAQFIPHGPDIVLPVGAWYNQDAHCTIFGWRRPRKGEYGKHVSKYHHALDPIPYYGYRVHDIEKGENEVETLYRWACRIRDFARDSNLRLTATAGGLATQLLRDQRWYPNPRRKVPGWINRATRHHLPGNHYRRFDKRDNVHGRAVYIDQTNAHHHATASLDLPDCNTLCGRGFTMYEPADLRRRGLLFARNGSATFKELMKHHGLFCLDVSVPPGLKMTLPTLEKSGGARTVYLWSNEIPTFIEQRGYIYGIYACWTSPLTEQEAGNPGLNAYAQWALSNQVKELKPILLMTYGMLAARARPLRVGWLRARAGVKRRYHVGSRQIGVREFRIPVGEPQFVNVVHRGMIEAETRMQTLKLARELSNTGVKVLSVCADAVIVQDGQLPLLEHPWRIKSELHGLRYLSETGTHWVARERSCLPGITPEIREAYLKHRQARSALAIKARERA